MSFADIENTWRSPHNRPDPGQLEKQKMEFITDLNKRRRGNLLLLWLVFSLLVFLTGKLSLQVFWPDPSLDKVDLSREWAFIPFFALPWIGWGVLVYLHRRNARRHPRVGDSIHASVAALLEDNRSERARYKVIAGLLGASVLVLPAVVDQLRAVGKAGDEILVPAFVIYPLYVLGTLIWAFIHDRRRLLPRKRELETLLKSYE
jgi:hypothetical protein